MVSRIRSIAVRAARTFVQTFAAAVGAGAAGVVDVSTAKALVVAAGAAAFAAAMRAVDFSAIWSPPSD